MDQAAVSLQRIPALEALPWDSPQARPPYERKRNIIDPPTFPERLAAALERELKARGWNVYEFGHGICGDQGYVRFIFDCPCGNSILENMMFHRPMVAAIADRAIMIEHYVERMHEELQSHVAGDGLADG